MSELTEKAKKEIKNEIKEQKRRKNVLWVISHRRENTGNMQSWPQKKTDVSFLVQNYYYNCLIWKLCANNPPWFLRNSPPCTHPLASPLHVAVITAGQNSKLWIVKKTYFYLKQGWMRGVQSLSAEGQAWLLLSTGEKKYCQPLPLQLLAILLSLLIVILINNNNSFFGEKSALYIKQYFQWRLGRLVFSGSRRQGLSASWDSSYWEEVCER